MAEKSKGGGGFFWLIIGMLLGIALTLGALMFLNSGPVAGDDEMSAADSAAASAALEGEGPAAVEPAQLPAPVAKAPTPRQPDAGLDPHTDDQIAEDAAAAGMTSRPQPAE